MATRQFVVGGTFPMVINQTSKKQYVTGVTFVINAIVGGARTFFAIFS